MKIYINRIIERLPQFTKKEKKIESFIYSFVVILSIFVVVYASSSIFGLIKKINALQSCPSSLSSGIVTSQIVITPDSTDGIIDCSQFDIHIGSTGEVIVERFVTDNNSLSGDWGVTILARNLTIDSGGIINADGKGYQIGEAESTGGDGGTSLGSTGGSGGGHGGAGGEGIPDGVNPAATPGIAYGNQEIPNTLGSAGGNSGQGGLGGNGGGSIKIVVTNTFTNNGIISANGLDGQPASGSGAISSGGGGAGGSIWIQSDIIAGSGIVRANGGSSAETTHQGGGGSGGRLIMFCESSNNFSGSASVSQGVTSLSQDGGVGTILGPTCRPYEPTIMYQFKADSTTSIPVNGISTESTVIFASNMSDVDSSDTLSLQVELRPLGTPFTGVPNFTQPIASPNPRACASPTTDCGKITATGLTRSTEYHWQARVRDNKGGFSDWVSFGANTENDRDVLLTGDPSKILLVGGNNQTAQVNTILSSDLSVKITDAVGFPVPGYSVTWVVTQSAGGGSLINGTPTVSDNDGIAINRYKLGTITGNGNNLIEARATGLTGTPVVFSENATPGSIDHFTVVAPQVVITNNALSSVTITAYDEFNNVKTDYVGTPSTSPVQPLPNYDPASGTLTPSSISFTSGDSGIVTIANSFSHNTQESIRIKVSDGVAVGRSNIIAVVDTLGACPDQDGYIDVSQTWTANTSNMGIFDCTNVSIHILDNATLTLDSDEGNGLNVTVLTNNVTVDNGSTITGEGKGYPYQSGTGAGTGELGGSYGGYAYNVSDSNKIYGSVYEPTNAGSGGGTTSTTYGGYGGPGGGAIKLVISNALINNGIIQANGGNGVDATASGAGGAGGSIWIDTNTINGTGIITTNGGNGENGLMGTGNGGAGGRIAIYYSTNSGFNLNVNNIQSRGGMRPGGSNYGGPGTIYIEQKSVDPIRGGHLFVDNNNVNSAHAGLVQDTYQFTDVNLTRYGHLDVIGQSSVLTVSSGTGLLGDSTFPDLTIYGTFNYTGTTELFINGVDVGIRGNITGVTDFTLGNTLQGGMTLYANTWYHNNTVPYTFEDVTIGQSGTLTLASYDNGDTNFNNDYGVTLNVNNLNIVNGGIVTSTGLGYPKETGTGAGTGSVGGSYGGYGYNINTATKIYGSVYEPVHLGSGGGNSSNTYGGWGGAGGGAMKITVSGTLNNNGSIISNGANGYKNNDAGGSGGSGGSIWIDTNVINGAGIISTNGGTGENGLMGTGNGGAGGRISLYYSTNNGFSLDVEHVQSRGGSRKDLSNYSGAGTVYIEQEGVDVAKTGKLYVDNNSHNFNPAGLVENTYQFSSINLTRYGHLDVLGQGSVVSVSSGNGLIGDSTFPDLTVYGTFNYTGTSELFINGVDVGIRGDISGVDDFTLGNTLQGGMTLYANTWAHNSTTPYTFGNVTIGSLGTMTLISYTDGDTDYSDDYGTTLNLDSLNLNAGGVITTNGTGYVHRVNVVTQGSGGSYGGFAQEPVSQPYGSVKEPISLGAPGYTGNTTYNGLGSAGGGAIKLNISGNFNLNGTLSANGADKTNGCTHGTQTGAGSGGSIWIIANQLNGSGLITTNGGRELKCGDSNGSGGRIAVYRQSGTFDLYSKAQIQSFGYAGAGPGTIYIDGDGSTGGNGDLRVNNNNLNTGYAAGIPYDSVNPVQEFNKIYVKEYGHLRVIGINSTLKITSEAGIEGDTTKPTVSTEGLLDLPGTFTIDRVVMDIRGDISGAANLTIGNGTDPAGMLLYAFTQKRQTNYSPNQSLYNNFENIEVKANGLLKLNSYVGNSSATTDDNMYGANAYGIILDLSNLNVNASGLVSSELSGYPKDTGPGAGGEGSGGSYGGYGGGNSTSGNIYGSIYLPRDLGSGGRTTSQTYAGFGGAGGGSIEIIASNEVINNGTISSAGQNGINDWSAAGAGGSGGSIIINTSIFSGNGIFNVNGGNKASGGGPPGWGSGYIGGGAGGRIALYYINTTFPIEDLSHFQSFGGSGQDGYAGPGTIYIENKTSDPIGEGNLYISNNGNNGGYTGDFSGEYNLNNVFIGDNVKVRVQGNTSTNSGVVFNLRGNFVLGTGALVDGVGLGYQTTLGPGSGQSGLGQSGGAGGAHGGSGGDGQSDGGNPIPSGGNFYGNQRIPLTLGSGGGRSGLGTSGGAGGSAFAIRARNGYINILGSINVSGTDGLVASPGGGGGAGGAILIEGDTCDISGTLLAQGGDGGDEAFDGGGGGGGRISILYTTGPCNVSGSVSVSQGVSSGGQTGQIGTYPGTLILPSVPSTRNQFKSDALTNIPVGGITQEQDVILKASAFDPGASSSDPVNLVAEFEVVQKNDSFSSPVLGVGVTSSSPISFSGGTPITVQATIDGLTPGEEYKWQVRVKNVDEGVSSSWTSFGGNPETDPDFIVGTTEHIRIEVDKTSVDVGESISVTVTALDGSWVTDPNYSGTVHFTSTSPTAVVPANYIFSSGDNGVHTFTNQLIFTEAGTFTISVNDTVNSSLTDTSPSITVNGPAVTPSPSPSVTLEPSPSVTPTGSGTVTPGVTSTPSQTCFENVNQSICQVPVVITNVTISPSETDSKVCWSTNIDTIGFIQYGLIDSDSGIGTLTNSTNVDNTYSTHHCITLSNLEPVSSYVIRINATSFAGKSASKDDQFATLGGTIPTDVVVNECISYDPYSYSFNSNHEAIVRYTTSGNASCTLYYGHSSSDLPFVSKSTSDGNIHSGTIDLTKLDGKNDLLFRMDCQVEGVASMCSINGSIPLSRYRDYYPYPEVEDEEFEFSEAVKALATTFVPVSLVTLTVGTSLLNLLTYPRFILYALGWLKDKKKSKPWGIVYDDTTRKPVAFASVKVYNQSGSFLLEKITNTEGKYGFPLSKGVYKLVISHPEYKVFKAEVDIKEEENIVSRDIPMSKSLTKANKVKSSLQENLRTINNVIVYTGFTFSLVALLITPIWYNFLILALYIVQFVIIALLKSQRGWGYVFNSLTRNRIEGVFIRVYSPKEGKQLDIQMTDRYGRYGFMLDDGEYRLVANAEGFRFPSNMQDARDLYKSKTGQVFIVANVKKGRPINIAIPIDPV